MKCPGEDRSVVKIMAAAHILFDRGGSLWLATDTSGVVRVAHPELLSEQAVSRAAEKLETFNSRNGLSADSCTPILEDREGIYGWQRGMDWTSSAIQPSFRLLCQHRSTELPWRRLTTAISGLSAVGPMQEEFTVTLRTPHFATLVPLEHTEILAVLLGS